MLHGGIQCSHIHYAWDQTKSVRQNLAEMGLTMDPNRAVPLIKRKVKAMEVDGEERLKELVWKPYVLNDLEGEASLPEKKGNMLSRDLINCVCYMVENHGEDYKAMALEEKNY
uniref:Nucleolar protein 16 n=1 Tax=Sus scrofa TaxID=9823 RepID=A0A8D0WFU6_PIG